MSHHAIVAAVLSDAKGAAIVLQARRAKPNAWSDDRSSAANMVAWFSQKITEGTSAWGDLFDREKQGGVWAYRPKTAMVQPLPVDPEAVEAIEGEPKWYFHLKRERDAGIAAAKRSAAKQPDGRLLCEACGFAAQSAYPGLSSDLCEVHHRRPLSDAASATPTTLEDLAVLCPNCHRAIHRTNPLMSVEQFKLRFFAKAG